MTALADLPRDLLDAILSSLESTDLQALCLANHSFQENAQRYLYKNIRIHVKDEQDILKVSVLLITLLKHRYLTEFVRHINFSAPRVDVAQLYPRSNKTFEEDDSTTSHLFGVDYIEAFNLIGRFADEIKLDNRSEWVDCCKRGSSNSVYVALVLALLPNLQSLRLACMFQVDSHYISTILRKAAFDKWRGHGFNTLEVVDLGSEMGDLQNYELPPIDTRQLTSLLTIQSIQKFSAVVSNEELVFEKDLPICHAPNLRFLNLRFCRLVDDSLAKLLGIATNLQTLRLSVPLLHKQKQVDFLFNSPTFASALEQVSTTLQVLHIEMSYAFADMDYQWPFERLGVQGFGAGAKDHLIGFPCLQDLQIPFVALFGWEASEPQDVSGMLPQSLKSLVLTDGGTHEPCYESDGMAVMQSLRGLLTNMPRNGIQLDFFSLDIPDAWDRSIEQELKDVCEAVGIRHSITV